MTIELSVFGANIFSENYIEFRSAYIFPHNKDSFDKITNNNGNTGAKYRASLIPTALATPDEASHNNIRPAPIYNNVAIFVGSSTTNTRPIPQLSPQESNDKNKIQRIYIGRYKTLNLLRIMYVPFIYLLLFNLYQTIYYYILFFCAAQKPRCARRVHFSRSLRLTVECIH